MNAFSFRDLSSINWQLLFVRVYTLVRTVIEATTKQTVKSTRFLVNSFVEDTYYSFENCYAPVSATSVKGGHGSAKASYVYNRDTKVITSLAGSTEGRIPHVSNILEAKLSLGDLELYDLTNFFDTVEFVSATQGDFPPILTWLGFWSLETGVFLDQSKKFILTLEMIDGETFSFPVWESQATFQEKWQTLNTPMTLHRQPEQPLEEHYDSNDDVPGSSNAAAATSLPAPTQTLDRQETTMLASPIAAPAEVSAPPPEN